MSRQYYDPWRVLGYFITPEANRVFKSCSYKQTWILNVNTRKSAGGGGGNLVVSQFPDLVSENSSCTNTPDFENDYRFGLII